MPNGQAITGRQSGEGGAAGDADRQRPGPGDEPARKRRPGTGVSESARQRPRPTVTIGGQTATVSSSRADTGRGRAILRHRHRARWRERLEPGRGVDRRADQQRVEFARAVAVKFAALSQFALVELLNAVKLNISRCMFLALLFGSAILVFGNDIAIKSTGQTVVNGQDQNIRSRRTTPIKPQRPPVLVDVTSAKRANGWGNNNPTGLWVGPATDQSNATRSGTCCVGDTVYRTDFSLAGLEPSSASLTLNVLADDWVTVYLNGSDQAHVVYSPPEVMYLSPVTIQVQAGFVAGNNYLEFHVHNAGGPTGLNVSATGTANPIVPGPPVLSISPASVYLTAVKGSPFSAADSAGIWVRNAGGGGPQQLQFSLADSPQCPSFNKSTFFALKLPTTTKQLTPPSRCSASEPTRPVSRSTRGFIGSTSTLLGLELRGSLRKLPAHRRSRSVLLKQDRLGIQCAGEDRNSE